MSAGRYGCIGFSGQSERAASDYTGRMNPGLTAATSLGLHATRFVERRPQRRLASRDPQASSGATGEVERGSASEASGGDPSRAQGSTTQRYKSARSVQESPLAARAAATPTPRARRRQSPG